MAEKQYIDLETGLGRVRGNKKLYRRMLDLLLQSGEFDALEECLTAGDCTRGAEVAHAIKGMTGNLALTELFETSTALLGEMRGGSFQEATVAAYRAAAANTRTAVEDLARQLDAELGS